ncbi:enoyl-CoA hydratase-related protein [Portibacter lacus]|uniref:Enoyl-CoA hydratase/isomerase family protein n=1 Tax=Portibacter lacus TaxID=1099794 RepID=A0AA37WFS2_9BACT|nr:enoyl-CoA hydratase-related protein [Portibacter lacus]GLR17175.1 hypothetical protein GCM10007940_17900 [Portibacter lacus]
MKLTLDYIKTHISPLTDKDSALWGILDAHHMVEHLIYLFKMSIGEIQQDIITPKEKIDRYQQSLYGERRIPKHFKNPYLKSDEQEKLEFASLDEAKEALYEYFEIYEKYYSEHPLAENNHIVYGPLNKEKWDLIHKKHFEHHIRQFDLKKHNPAGYIDQYIEKNGVAYIEFFHPSHNALPSYLLSELTEAIRKYDTHTDAQVIILKSGGNRTFCAGASFDELIAISNAEEGHSFFSGFANVINAIRKCSKLIIGCVQGKAVGGGVGIASAVDYCFATNYASIKLSELGIGIGPFVIGPAVERKIGTSAFSQLTLEFKRFFDANWALDKGLYHQVHDTALSMETAVRIFAEELCHTNPEARASIKKMLWSGTDHWDVLLNERAITSGKLVLSEFTKSKLSALKKKA